MTRQVGENERADIEIADDVLAAGFVQVPVVIMQAADLSFGAKLCYGALLWYHYKGRGFPGQKAMAATFGISHRSITRFLGELQEGGYLVVTRRGVGLTNRYYIPTLQSVRQDGESRVAKLANPVRQDGESYNRTLDSKTHTLSLELAAALMDALGRSKPAAAEKKRAQRIIGELLTEGHDEPTIREAIRLAPIRNAQGPELLPHLIGEAHANLEADAMRAAQVAVDAAVSDREASTRRQEQEAALASLSPEEYADLEAQAIRDRGGKRPNDAALRGLVAGLAMRRVAPA